MLFLQEVPTVFRNLAQLGVISHTAALETRSDSVRRGDAGGIKGGDEMEPLSV